MSERPAVAHPHAETDCRRRILVVNSNTSELNTTGIATAIGASGVARSSLSFATTRQGPEGIDSLLDMTIASIETARLIAANADAFDAFIIACGNDPGLLASRQVTDRPVVGIAEAGMHMACMLGMRFSIPVLSRAKVSLMVDLVRRYGLDSRLASVLPLEASSAEAIRDRERLFPDLLRIGELARDRDLAEVMVLTGSAMSGLELRLEAELGMPVVCGLTAAVVMVEGFCDLQLATSHVHSFRNPKKLDALHGYEDLQGLYAANDRSTKTARDTE